MARHSTKPKRTAFQNEGMRIFHAQRAAERIIERTNVERGAVMSLSRDELSALAQQMIAVATIAESYHLEKATSGALPPESFAGPVE